MKFSLQATVKNHSYFVVRRPPLQHEIIPLDTTPLRHEWLGYYHELEAKLAKLKREWNQFEREAQDLFRAWYHSYFSELINDIRQEEEKSEQTRLILSAIRAQIRVNQLSKREAYQKVMKAIEKNQDPYPTEAEEQALRERKNEELRAQIRAFQGEQAASEIDEELLEKARLSVQARVNSAFHSPRSAFEAERIRHATQQAIHLLYEALMKEKSDGSEEIPNHEPVGEHPSPSPEHKTLYRKIVRLLHPDRGSEMSELEKDLWEKTQAAYRNESTEILRVILLRIEGVSPLHLKNTGSLSEIRDLVLGLRQEMAEINYHKNQVKKDAVYRFWASRNRPGNREKLKLELERGLRHQLFYHQKIGRELRSELKGLERSLRQ